MRTGTDAMSQPFLEDLSEPQREAVTHTDGPLLILAGPGSGKTRVVTRRAVHLAQTVTSPVHVLAVTFTNKAAREMQDRIGALGVEEGMTVGTFHSLCARLLRRYHDRAGVPRNYTIFDTDDRRKLVKQAIGRCDLSTDNWSPSMVEREIGLAKNAMLTAEDFAAKDIDWRQRTLATIYTAYEALLEEMGGLDFDDLLMRMALLLEQDADLRDVLEDRFRYVLIDEYQDTNVAQYRIARDLTRKRKNLCATGDPDQSIYGWRGANIENILGFERDYPEAKVVRLEQNYRSTQRILSAADAVIAGNTRRKEKTLWTNNDEGPAVRMAEVESGDDEAALIASEIARQGRERGTVGDTAVFYRVNSLSRLIEEALIREGVAYQIARGVEFYSRKEIKDVLAYLRVLVNPSDEVAVLRIINTPPRGIGSTTINRLVEHARTTGRRIYDIVTGGDDLAPLGRSAGKVREFGELLGRLAKALDRPAREAVEFIVSHSGLRALYGAAADADGRPIENIEELINAAFEFQQEHEGATVLDWLEHTALLSDVDTLKDERGCVTLSTLHAAKGLEFSDVYVTGLEEGLLPLRRRDDDEIDIEEERRLLFVGMTRAKRRLTLSRARYRMMRGVTERTVRSPFVDELPGDQIEWVASDDRPKRARAGVPSGHLPEDIDRWEIGTLVQHARYGLGQIVGMHRGARRTHVDVQFKDGSRRSWVLEFAQLERVDFDDIG
jgi:DNA helicase-2/ATP-dependent DNA helicase PcrA